MKRNALTAALLSLLMASPALAAGSRQDSSGLVVWIFLGFCALIVVAQLVPVVLMAFGIIRGVAQGKEEPGHPEHAREAARH